MTRLLLMMVAALGACGCIAAMTVSAHPQLSFLAVKPPRPPSWRVSAAPKPLPLRMKTTFLYLPQNVATVALDDAGDINHDGLRDLLLKFGGPVDIGGHRSQAAIVYGDRRFRSLTIAAAARAGRARLFVGANPPLPRHSYRSPTNAGDVDGDRRPDQDQLALDWSEAHYACGGGTPYCVTQYVAARFTARSATGRVLFDYGGPWHKLLVGRGAYSGLTGYGWLGDWNRDGRADLFEADPTGVFVYALTPRGLRRAPLGLAAPIGTQPYLPIALRFSSGKKADLVGLSTDSKSHAVAIVSSQG
jgi:hypothetical protein